jgi:hypothetical protein
MKNDDENQLALEIELAMMRHAWAHDQIAGGGANPVLVAFEQESLADLRSQIGALQSRLEQLVAVAPGARDAINRLRDVAEALDRNDLKLALALARQIPSEI